MRAFADILSSFCLPLVPVTALATRMTATANEDIRFAILCDIVSASTPRHWHPHMGIASVTRENRNGRGSFPRCILGMRFRKYGRGFREIPHNESLPIVAPVGRSLKA